MATPFQICRIQFYFGESPTPATNTSPPLCTYADFVSQLFTNQKSGIKGESIGQIETGHPRACAVTSIRQHVTHLQQHGPGGHTPLNAVNHKKRGHQFEAQRSTRPPEGQWQYLDHNPALIFYFDYPVYQHFLEWGVSNQKHYCNYQHRHSNNHHKKNYAEESSGYIFQ